MLKGKSVLTDFPFNIERVLRISKENIKIK